jgi:PiT family inorganic phosphate transporter
MIEVFLFFLILLLASSNGANDISKGIATLVGSGAASFRSATLWGVLTTAIGSVAAIAFGGVLLTVFSNGVLMGAVDPARIAVAVACGAALWVFVSSRLGLPVSTTHAIIGGIVGAGLAEFGGSGLNWSSLVSMALLPLLVSPIASFSLSYILFPALSRKLSKSNAYCLCVHESETAIATSGALTMTLPVLHVSRGEVKECSADGDVRFSMKIVDTLHLFSGGLTSFARGLNDTPKMAALLVGTHAMAMSSSALPYVVVGIGVILGGLIGGRRVTETLSRKITSLDAVEGFASNAITSVLVICGSFLGMPFSTTHVSTSSIVGIGVASGEGIRWKIVQDILLAWVVTLPGAGIGAFIVQKSL